MEGTPLPLSPDCPICLLARTCAQLTWGAFPRSGSVLLTIDGERFNGSSDMEPRMELPPMPMHVSPRVRFSEDDMPSRRSWRFRSDVSGTAIRDPQNE